MSDIPETSDVTSFKIGVLNHIITLHSFLRERFQYCHKISVNTEANITWMTIFF